jgi:ribosomal protein S18 acetylase RimI-like enzyme
MEINIREALAEDYDDIWPLLKQLYIKDKISRTKTKNIFLNRLNDADTVQLVATEGNKIIGFASFKIMGNIQSQGNIALLTELIIEENHRNKGFGTMLMSKIMSIAKRKKCIELQFSSAFRRRRAHDFYKALGFNRTAYYFWKEL